MRISPPRKRRLFHPSANSVLESICPVSTLIPGLPLLAASALIQARHDAAVADSAPAMDDGSFSIRQALSTPPEPAKPDPATVAVPRSRATVAITAMPRQNVPDHPRPDLLSIPVIATASSPAMSASPATFQPATTARPRPVAQPQPVARPARTAMPSPSTDVEGIRPMTHAPIPPGDGNTGNDLGGVASGGPTIMAASPNLGASGGFNSPPNAGNDSATTFGLTPVSVPVLNNDSDPDGDPLHVASFTQGSYGTVQRSQTNSDVLVYTPAAGFYHGNDAFIYTISDGQGHTSMATVTINVWTWIEHVDWVASPGSPLDANPGPGSGQRIFPDKDNPNDSIDHSQVYVRAYLGQAVAGIKINLKVIDVDDPGPSARTKPIDDESNGTDNRDTNVPYSVVTVTTNAQGWGQFTFDKVSMQPGDNYRVVASLDSIGLGQYTAIQDDGTQAGIKDNSQGGARVPTFGPGITVASDLLTVWRRLHIEVDSMGTVFGNHVAGNMDVPRIAPGATSVVVDTDQDLPDGEDNRFVPGTLTDSAGHTFTVLGNTQGSNFTVTLQLVAGGPVPVNGIFTLLDDDTLKDGARLGDPETATLATALAAAYVVPILKDVGFNNPNDPFVLNAKDESQRDQIRQATWDSRNLNADDFWVAFLLEAYQGSYAEDGDPNTETITFGQTGADGGSLIYQEINAESARRTATPFSVVEGDTVVHEIGHAVGNAPEPVTNDLKGAPSQYTPDALNGIRSCKKPRS